MPYIYTHPNGYVPHTFNGSATRSAKAQIRWTTGDARHARDKGNNWTSLGQLLCITHVGSMYGIYGNIYHQYTPNVSIYTIHGSYGEWQRANKGIVGFVYVKSLETMVILANNNKITMVSRHGWFYGVQIHQFESLKKI